MKLCERCRGGELGLVNCPACGGNGFVSEEVATIPPTGLTPVSPQCRRHQLRLNREAREAEKSRRISTYRVSHQRSSLSEEEKAAFRASYLMRQQQRARESRAAYMARLNQLSLSPRSLETDDIRSHHLCD